MVANIVPAATRRSEKQQRTAFLCPSAVDALLGWQRHHLSSVRHKTHLVCLSVRVPISFDARAKGSHPDTKENPDMRQCGRREMTHLKVATLFSFVSCFLRSLPRLVAWNTPATPRTHTYVVGTSHYIMVLLPVPFLTTDSQSVNACTTTATSTPRPTPGISSTTIYRIHCCSNNTIGSDININIAITINIAININNNDRPSDR